MKKVVCKVIQKLIMGITVVSIGILAVPVCLLLGIIIAIWSAANAAIRYLE